MEFCKKEIVQIRAKYNQNPPKEVWGAAEIWKKKSIKTEGERMLNKEKI